LMTDAANVAQGVRREASTAFRSQTERWIADLDLVKREDFDVVREMASTAREENERLAARIAELEAQLAAKSAKSASKAAETGEAAAPKPKRTPRKATKAPE
jgi:BMFP domain-containing protein YqiC